MPVGVYNVYRNIDIQQISQISLYLHIAAPQSNNAVCDILPILGFFFT